MKKLGKSTFKGEFKIIKKFLTSMGFVLDRTGKHGSVWKHTEKNLTTNVTTSSSDWRWYKNWKSDFTKLINDNFTIQEIEELLAKLIKKRKVRFTEDGRVDCSGWCRWSRLEYPSRSNAPFGLSYSGDRSI